MGWGSVTLWSVKGEIEEEGGTDTGIHTEGARGGRRGLPPPPPFEIPPPPLLNQHKYNNKVVLKHIQTNVAAKSYASV